uniref:Uncharacterized protein n=1 Tax=Caenorhabditis brenneri TaxID=135651 RepID=B6VBS1_CAEBE|nr:hypothetical protein Cbre_JD22.002 [Caenorhabditis brenneri]
MKELRKSVSLWKGLKKLALLVSNLIKRKQNVVEPVVEVQIDENISLRPVDLCRLKMAIFLNADADWNVKYSRK